MKEEKWYVYFIFKGRKLVYIGMSASLIFRILAHRSSMNDEKYTIYIYGTYDKETAQIKEAYEIYKQHKRKTSHFINKSNKNYGHSKKLSVKNYEEKLVLYFNERGKITKVVSKHFDKFYFRNFCGAIKAGGPRKWITQAIY